MGWIRILLKDFLTNNQVDIIQQYEDHLRYYGSGKDLSFTFKLKPTVFEDYIQEQFVEYIGGEIKQELELRGKREAVYRAAEALMKHFNGYSTIDIDKGTHYLNEDNSYFIEENNNDGIIPKYRFALVNWWFISDYYNRDDNEEIKKVYDFSEFEVSRLF